MMVMAQWQLSVSTLKSKFFFCYQLFVQSLECIASIITRLFRPVQFNYIFRLHNFRRS